MAYQRKLDTLWIKTRKNKRDNRNRMFDVWATRCVNFKFQSLKHSQKRMDMISVKKQGKQPY